MAQKVKREQKKIKKLRDNLGVPLSKAKKIFEIAQEKKGDSKVCEQNIAEDREKDVTPIVEAKYEKLKQRLAA